MANAAAMQKFMDSLDTETVIKCLQQIAELPEKERSAIIANPTPYFKKAGLKVPRGVTVRVSAQPFNRDAVPAELQPHLPALERPELFCFWVDYYLMTSSGYVYLTSKLICVTVQVRGGWNPL